MRAFSFRSRISSMPRFEAASISMTSKARLVFTASQAGQVLQGSPIFLNSGSESRFRQFMVLAIRRAIDVLPMPRGPDKR